MVYLPGGTFRMGSEKGHGDEKPVHEVTLDAFAVGRYPVTVGEYLRFARETGKNYPEWLEEGSEYHLDTGEKDHYRRVGVSPEKGQLPVVGVSWEDARSYCEWLSEQTGEHYGLLTEAEWEFACRAGSESDYCFGDDRKLLDQFAWYSENSGSTLHDVGLKKANDWGIHDMHGLVREWVQDRFGDYPSERQRNPSGPESGRLRVLRGGSWCNSADDCRSADRSHDGPGLRHHYLGFRLSRTV